MLAFAGAIVDGSRSLLNFEAAIRKFPDYDDRDYLAWHPAPIYLRVKLEERDNRM